MSASTEKKLRAQAREEGTDRKSIEAQEVEKKARKVRTWTVIAIIGVIILVAGVLVLNSDYLYRNTVALKIGEDNFSPAEVNYTFNTEYQNIVGTYGDYISLIGLDTSYGVAGLASQTCPLAEVEGTSWRDYLLSQAEEDLKRYYVLNKYAREKGITLSDENRADIEEQCAQFETYAEAYGLASADKFASAYFGRGVNMAVVKAMLGYSTLAQQTYSDYMDGITVTNEEINELYPSKAVRHILIKAEADENGEYSDEALTAAKSRAEAILEEWKLGAATEETFAALAEKYSEDEGSNTNGGLYANVMEGTTVTEFNDFVFDPERKSGDTGIVYGNNGGYAGYHIMYYVGDGDPQTNTSAMTQIRSEKANEWLEGLSEGVVPEECFWIRLVGKS